MILRTVQSVGSGTELHPPGSTIEVTDAIGKYLIDKGAAILEKDSPKQTRAEAAAEAAAVSVDEHAASEHPKDEEPVVKEPPKNGPKLPAKS